MSCKCPPCPLRAALGVSPRCWTLVKRKLLPGVGRFWKTPNYPKNCSGTVASVTCCPKVFSRGSGVSGSPYVATRYPCGFGSRGATVKDKSWTEEQQEKAASRLPVPWPSQLAGSYCLHRYLQR